jgi:serine phosphatase RsbU (regulator of sigma subunit)/anti-anti-sigma regulatory factor
MVDGDSPAEAVRSKVLIVDDEPSVREVLMAMLGTIKEYDLFQASNGAEAQKLLQDNEIDVVITDLLMPKLDGLSLMQWGRETRPGSMWIILTAQGSFDAAVRAVQLGAFDFIPKPLGTMEPLLIAVRNAVKQRQLSRERERLHLDIESRNVRLRRQVTQLQEACRILCRQADMIESDLRRAELIQRALLPRETLHTEGLAFHVLYRPSRKVGGDLYDIAGVDDGRVVFYVADAAGHGVSAAMLAVLFKHRLAMMDHDYQANPPSVALAAANASLMAECAAPGLFVTAAYCLLDTKSRELVVASAGHPPIVLLRGTGEIEMIYHTGPALGLTESAQFAEKRIALEPGDRLLLYTDGLMDAEGDGDSLTADQMVRMLQTPANRDSEALRALFSAAADRRGGAEQEDDITLLLLDAATVDSTIDNGTPSPVTISGAPPLDAKAEVLMGRQQDTTTLCISGRGTWTHCAAFHEVCASELELGHSLTLDLSLCVHLDSTFLGTIQEIVDRAERRSVELRIQGVLPQVRALFEELGMVRVLQRVVGEMAPMPGQMVPVDTSERGDHRDAVRMLRAHRALASLSDSNRNEFLQLIRGLEAEMADTDTDAC